MTGPHGIYRWMAPTAALLGVVSAMVSLPLPLRVVLAAGCTMFAPGYALVDALWPTATLAWAERLLLTAASSLALVTLMAVTVAALPMRLTAGSISVALFALTTGLFTLAQLRKRARGNSVGERASVGNLRWRPVDFASIAIAAAVAVGALAIGQVGTIRADSATTFSELYFQSTPTDNRSIVVGVRSFERRPTTFRLVVTATGQPQPLLSVAALHLADGETSERTIVVPARVRLASVRAVLYLAGSDTAYREISLGG